MERQVDVSFIPFDAANPYQRELSRHLADHGVRVKGRPWVKGLPLRVLRRHEHPDIIHLHWLPRVSGVAGLARSILFLARLVALRLLGTRIVWTAHNLYSHEATWRAGERFMTRFVTRVASRVIVHSQSARSLVAREFAVRAEEKLQIIPHGTFAGSYPNRVSREEARRRLALDPDALVFLFFGNIRAYKGVPELVAAYRELDAPDPRALIICGRVAGREVESAIRAQAHDCPTITLHTGFVADDEVQVYMNAADVVVFPYRDVLTSGAVVLAMSFARACVAPKSGCIPDMLDAAGAFLYDPNDPAGLLKALRMAVDARGRLSQMGLHNSQVAAGWSWDVVARDTHRVYREALR